MIIRVHTIFFIIAYEVNCNEMDDLQSNFCRNIKCDDWPVRNVCGIKVESEGFRLKLFENECQLQKYRCEVDRNTAYGKINLEYCETAFFNRTFSKIVLNSENENGLNFEEKENSNRDNNCKHINCTSEKDDAENICAIKKDGIGYKVRLFTNRCELEIHNCKANVTFFVTDLFICDSIFNNVKLESYDDPDKDEAIEQDSIGLPIKNLVIVDTNIFDGKNFNDSIETFFAATHVLDLPMREVKSDVINEITRRRLIPIAGPVKVFQPWIVIPDNITDDYMHSPTLSSCYHKCPTKCPDTYAPVCGVPGIVAREPSIMFQNHCFMDVAQCKMRWEDKSSTAISSSYIESSFMFCLGDQLNAMYRFLPLVRTLQHMGRLKKKGRFRFKLRNMRFFNNLLMRDPKLMG